METKWHVVHLIFQLFENFFQFLTIIIVTNKSDMYKIDEGCSLEVELQAEDEKWLTDYLDDQDILVFKDVCTATPENYHEISFSTYKSLMASKEKAESELQRYYNDYWVAFEAGVFD